MSYLTVNPCDMGVSKFAEHFNKTIEEEHIPLYLLGRMVQKIEQQEMPENVKIIKSIEALSAVLK